MKKKRVEKIGRKKQKRAGGLRGVRKETYRVWEIGGEGFWGGGDRDNQDVDHRIR